MGTTWDGFDAVTYATLIPSLSHALNRTLLLTLVRKTMLLALVLLGLQRVPRVGSRDLFVRAEVALFVLPSIGRAVATRSSWVDE